MGRTVGSLTLTDRGELIPNVAHTTAIFALTNTKGPQRGSRKGLSTK